MLAGALFAIELVVHNLVLLARLGLPGWADGVVDGAVFTLLAGPLVAWTLYRRHVATPPIGGTTIAADSPHRRVRSAILGALGALAVAVALGLFGQLYVSERSAEYARLINLAGRQRTLSQVVARQAAAIPAVDRDTLASTAARLDRESRELHQAVDALVARDPAGLQVVRQALTRTDSLRRALLYAANRVARSDISSRAVSREALPLADAMLPLMERAVSELQRASERDNAQTVKAAVAVAASLCLLLVLIASHSAFCALPATDARGTHHHAPRANGPLASSAGDARLFLRMFEAIVESGFVAGNRHRLGNRHKLRPALRAKLVGNFAIGQAP